MAIGIPDPYGAELQDWRKRIGDPNAEAIPPHITLLPPLLISTGGLPVIEQHLAGIAASERSFRIHLSGSGTFRPVSPVVFIRLVEGAGDCGRLERRVRSDVLVRTLVFPYHPHVTVAHDLADDVLDRAAEELADYDARFQVSGFSLFGQGADSVWRPIRHFRFTG